MESVLCAARWLSSFGGDAEHDLVAACAGLSSTLFQYSIKICQQNARLCTGPGPGSSQHALCCYCCRNLVGHQPARSEMHLEMVARVVTGPHALQPSSDTYIAKAMASCYKLFGAWTLLR